MNKIKNFILDTNILIHCPESIFKFADNNVYITDITMEELDGLKNEKGETGYNAREAIRLIHSLRKKGKLMNGVLTPGGGKIYMYSSGEAKENKLPAGWTTDKKDNCILLRAMELNKEKENTVLVTNDISMMLKADILELNVQNYRNDRVSEKEELYTGRREYEISKEAAQEFDKTGCIYICNTKEKTVIPEINEFLVLKQGEHRWLGRFNGEKIVKLEHATRKPFGVMPRNAGQFFAQEALLTSAEEVPLVILKGSAGTSKTFYSLACGLEQVVETNIYKRVLICRPNVKFDEDIGYLKGTEMDKILPLIRPSLDNLEALITLNEKKVMNFKPQELQDTIQEFFDRGWVTAEALAYLRGRSITNTFIIIDEAQNATPNQILGIITRAGKGSKICIIGDLDQIDTPRLDKYNNGLAFASERMKGSKLTMQLTFTDDECTRSELAKEAAERLGS